MSSKKQSGSSRNHGLPSREELIRMAKRTEDRVRETILSQVAAQSFMDQISQLSRCSEGAGANGTGSMTLEELEALPSDEDSDQSPQDKESLVAASTGNTNTNAPDANRETDEGAESSPERSQDEDVLPSSSSSLSLSSRRNGGSHRAQPATCSAQGSSVDSEGRSNYPAEDDMMSIGHETRLQEGVRSASDAQESYRRIGRPETAGGSNEDQDNLSVPPVSPDGTHGVDTDRSNHRATPIPAWVRRMKPRNSNRNSPVSHDTVIESEERVDERRDSTNASIEANAATSLPADQTMGQDQNQTEDAQRQSRSRSIQQRLTPKGRVTGPGKEVRKQARTPARKNRKRRANDSSGPAGATLRNTRARPGTRAIQEIRKYQRSTQLLIPKAPFQRLVRELTQQTEYCYYPSVDFRWKRDAIEAFQEGTEAYIQELMSNACLCSIHAKRVTLYPADIKLTRRVQLQSGRLSKT